MLWTVMLQQGKRSFAGGDLVQVIFEKQRYKQAQLLIWTQIFGSLSFFNTSRKSNRWNDGAKYQLQDKTICIEVSGSWRRKSAILNCTIKSESGAENDLLPWRVEIKEGQHSAGGEGFMVYGVSVKQWEHPAVWQDHPGLTFKCPIPNQRRKLVFSFFWGNYV